MLIKGNELKAPPPHSILPDNANILYLMLRGFFVALAMKQLKRELFYKKKFLSIRFHARRTINKQAYFLREPCASVFSVRKYFINLFNDTKKRARKRYKDE